MDQRGYALIRGEGWIHVSAPPPACLFSIPRPHLPSGKYSLMTNDIHPGVLLKSAIIVA